MNLDESQKQKVREWIQGGLQPAEVQKRLGDEFGLRLTYMEVRFLLADLDLKPKDREVASPAPAPVAPPAPKAPPAPAAGRAVPVAPGVDEPGDQATGGVQLAVDQVTRAGAVVSGKVTFSDGKSAEWYLDQMGRLGLAPREKGYRPPQEDLMEFQMALQNELAKLGF